MDRKQRADNWARKHNGISYSVGQRVYSTGESDVPTGVKGIIQEIREFDGEETYKVRWEGYGVERCREFDFKV